MSKKHIVCRCVEAGLEALLLVVHRHQNDCVIYVLIRLEEQLWTRWTDGQGEIWERCQYGYEYEHDILHSHPLFSAKLKLAGRKMRTTAITMTNLRICTNLSIQTSDSKSNLPR